MQGLYPIHGQYPFQGQYPIQLPFAVQGQVAQLPIHGQVPYHGQLPPQGQIPETTHLPASCRYWCRSAGLTPYFYCCPMGEFNLHRQQLATLTALLFRTYWFVSNLNNSRSQRKKKKNSTLP
jgi:hypothetical protein